MHWGVSPWANYSVIGLALAYFGFRKKKKGMISTTLIPLIGEERAEGWLGTLVDILAVFATVAGIVTSLGLGVMQINSGLHMVLGLPSNITVQIIIIVLISVISGRRHPGSRRGSRRSPTSISISLWDL